MVALRDDRGLVIDGGRTTIATARLLWAACRPAPEPEVVAARVDDGASLDLAARVAIARRVGPLLWRALVEADRLHCLGDVREELRKEYEVRRGQAALLLPIALSTAVEPLTRAGLEPVVLKGPAVARRYPDPGLRPMDDLDILLPPVQHKGAVKALEEAGWVLSSGPARHDYDTVLQHPAVPHFPLELHHDLESWRERAHELTAIDLWRARVPLDCMGTRAFGLPVEEELIALAAHAAKPYHHFERLIWSVDLAVIIGAAGPGLDWERVAERARQVGCTTMVAVGMCHARRLGATVPDELVVLPPSRLRRTVIAPLLDETWPIVGSDEGVAHRLRYALPDTRRRRALLALGEITTEGALGVPRRAASMVVLGTRRYLGWRRTGSFTEAESASLDGAAAAGRHGQTKEASWPTRT